MPPGDRLAWLGPGPFRNHDLVHAPWIPAGPARVRARSRPDVCDLGDWSDLGLRPQQPRAARPLDGRRARVRVARRSDSRLRRRGDRRRAGARRAHATSVRPARCHRRPLPARVGAGDRRTPLCARRRAGAARARLPCVFHGGHDLAHGGRGRGEQGQRAAAQSVSARRTAALLLASASAAGSGVSPGAPPDIDGASAAGQFGRARAGLRPVSVRLCPTVGAEPGRSRSWIARRVGVHELRRPRAAGRLLEHGCPALRGGRSEHRRGHALVLLEPPDRRPAATALVSAAPLDWIRAWSVGVAGTGPVTRRPDAADPGPLRLSARGDAALHHVCGDHADDDGGGNGGGDARLGAAVGDLGNWKRGGSDSARALGARREIAPLPGFVGVLASRCW